MNLPVHSTNYTTHINPTGDITVEKSQGKLKYPGVSAEGTLFIL
jgi:hypothetical protein